MPDCTYFGTCVDEDVCVRISALQELVELLQQRAVLPAEESSQEAELQRQVGSEPLCPQSSEVRLEGLVEELHAEARHRAAVAESLHAELLRFVR